MAALEATPPVIGTVKVTSFEELAIVNVALKHEDAEAPAAQLCCGLNEIAIVQDWPAGRLKEPSEGTPPIPQVSVSAKLAALLLFVKVAVRPSAEPDVFATVIVCEVAGEPSN